MIRSPRSGETILILGGAGMVGVQVAREAVRELRPARIILASLKQSEADEAAEQLRGEAKQVEIVPVAGNIFIPQALQEADRASLLADRAAFDLLFDEIFATDADFKSSALFRLVDEHRPDVLIDCINTATAISYQEGQDEFKSARKTKALLDAVQDGQSDKLPQLINAVRELLISQAVPQIARHILFLHRTLEETSVRVYVKVGTTGTGGMGINIPYTHSEDKPSQQLLAKSAVGFAHTGLLFLLARTPAGEAEKHGSIIKEVKPGALIGFKRLGRKHVTVRGERRPAYLVEPHEEPVGSSLDLRGPDGAVTDTKLEIVGADTGENGFFSIGEFQAITYPRQMEYVTPEEVARTVILEILGASTGRDVLAAIDGAITEPSYRAGVLREHALRELAELQEELRDEVLPSIAVGHLGPPKLSKLLAEAHLIREAAGTDDIETIREIAPWDMQARIEKYLAENPRIVSQIVTIGIPLLRARDGKLVLTRGPRISIPPPPPSGTVVPMDRERVEQYALTGWVDLRVENFERWQRRLQEMTSPDMRTQGSAAFEVTTYPGQRFTPGEVVGWLLTNDVDEQGMIGRRLY